MTTAISSTTSARTTTATVVNIEDEMAATPTQKTTSISTTILSRRTKSIPTTSGSPTDTRPQSKEQKVIADSKMIITHGAMAKAPTSRSHNSIIEVRGPRASTASMAAGATMMLAGIAAKATSNSTTREAPTTGNRTAVATADFTGE